MEDELESFRVISKLGVETDFKFLNSNYSGRKHVSDNLISASPKNVSKNILELNKTKVFDKNLDVETEEEQESLGLLKLDLEKDSSFLNLTFSKREHQTIPSVFITVSPKNVNKNASILNKTQVLDSLGLETAEEQESLGLLSKLDLESDSNSFNLTYSRIEQQQFFDSLIESSKNLGNNTTELNRGFLRTPRKSSNSDCLSFNNTSFELPSQIWVTTNTKGLPFPKQRSSLLNNAQLMISSPSENQLKCLSQPGNESALDEVFLNFLEGQETAQANVENLFLNTVPEYGILDCTPQPEWPDLDESEIDNKESPKSTSETVYKTIDKMFPNTTDKNKISRSDSTSSKSRDPKDIIQNLSEIFNCSRISDKQKFEGRILINSLSDLLNASQNRKNCEDSGHSSFSDNECTEKEEIDHKQSLNVIKKVKSSSNVSDIKLKRHSSESVAIVKSAPQKTERRNSVASVSNLNKAFSTTSKQNGIKLKSKVLQTKPKKGPLIAIIPLEDMKKMASNSNPTGKLQTLQSKKTSTPVNEPKLRSFATSTPVNNSKTGSQQSRKNSNDNKKEGGCGDSKTSITANSSGTRTSLPKVPINPKVQSHFNPIRRNSISEGTPKFQPKLQRSNSLGKDTKIASSLRKVRESLLNSPYYNKNNNNNILVDSSNKVGSKEERTVRFNEDGKSVTRKSLKENLHP